MEKRNETFDHAPPERRGDYHRLADAVQALSIRTGELTERIAALKSSQDNGYMDAREERKLLFSKIDTIKEQVSHELRHLYEHGCSFAKSNDDHEDRLRKSESRMDRMLGSVAAIAVILPMGWSMVWEWIKRKAGQ